MDQVKKLFEKKFSFVAENGEQLINADQLFVEPVWELKETRTINDDFEKVRNELNDKNIRAWGLHTARTDLSSDIIHRFRQKDVELSLRTWLKLNEILNSYPIINLDVKTSVIKACFLCEAPGCFILATNHYIKVNSPSCQFDWVATSLNPFHEEVDHVNVGISDDRFIRRTLDHWHFGGNNLGNILDPGFALDFIRKHGEQFDFVTGDGGINCFNDPTHQETISYPLQFNEFLIAINCLKNGGSMVIKLFTLFTSQICCLLFLMYSFFHEVHLIKPSCSKAGNSEVYAVCSTLKSDCRLQINALTSKYAKLTKKDENFLTSLSILSKSQISSFFLNQLIQCSDFFTSHQKTAILNNLNYFNYSQLVPNVYADIKSLQEKAADLYFQKFPYQSIKDADKLIAPINERYPRIPKAAKTAQIVIKNGFLEKFFRGESFNMRSQNTEPDYCKLLQFLNKSYSRKIVVNYFLNKYYKSLSQMGQTIDFSISYGLVARQVINSPWLHLDILHAYNHLLNLTKNQCHLISKSNQFAFKHELLHKLVKGHHTEPFFRSDKLLELFSQAKSNIYSFRKKNLDDHSECTVAAIWAKSDKAYNIHDNELTTISQLVNGLVGVHHIISLKDTLIINIDPPLRRIVVGIIYLLTFFFKSMAILPLFSLPNIEQNSLIDCGMLLVFFNNNRQLSGVDLNVCEKKLRETINYLKTLFENENCPIEIFSTSTLLRGKFKA